MIHDIVAFGDAVIDFTPYQEEGTYIRNFGGAPVNVCLAAVRLGGSAAFCGMVGNDMFGRFLANTMKENGIDSSGVRFTDDAITTMTFVSLTEDGDRDFVFARKPGADMFFGPAHINKDLLVGARVFHFCVLALNNKNLKEATYQMIDIVRANGGLISFDINYRENVWGAPEAALPEIRSVLEFVNLLKMSDDEALMLSETTSLEAALHFFEENSFRRLIVITCGPNGAYCLWQGQLYHQDALPADVVDTTGAGDAFWGAFLISLLERCGGTLEALTPDDLHYILRRAVGAGSLCTTQKGVVHSIPTSQQLDASLSEN